ncbi:helix-turn-helix protein [Streptomyces sp. Amel2xB2]|uniref:helix-turn-helix domain-containing protein n=1 Tax=Streptomyces sp. Amel2xB2 TaxID=1305829 RepID=UPI000DBA73C6|nr:helix-turn-helix transcriptional regulator [Streptomyces sp. Amel2xB2]RAJ61814.1 helix-turn-helix protein [Streptomyces sp. Amel2xB2]
MAEKDNSSATMRMFGSQLRLWRTRARYSREQLADEAGYALDTVASVEKGRRMPPSDLVETAETLFDAGGMLRDAASKIVRPKYPDWFEEYVQYEADAVSLGLYENQVIPGLFQSEAYANAVFLSSYPRLDDAEIERRLGARVERQALLSRTPRPMISAVVEQVVLERCIGGRQVMKDQLVHLMQIAELRDVDMQIMPTRRESHAGLNGPMYLIETDGQQRLVYSETQKGSVLISDPKDVSDLNLRYGMLRSQALTPEESMSLLRKTLEDL